MMPSTPQSDVSSSNIKQKQIVLLQVVEQPKHQVDDHVPTVQKANKLKLFKYQLIKRHFHPSRMKVIKFKYSFYLLDASYEPNALLLVLIPNQITTIAEAIRYQVLWPAQMVSLTTHSIQDSNKFKKQRNKETRLSSKDENPIDIKNFAILVGLLLKEGKVHAVNITNDVFGESCKSFLMNADMDIIISSTNVSSNCLMFYICWNGKASKESRSRVIANQLMNANHADFIFIPYNPSYHWVLVALNTRTVIAYYLDSLPDQPFDVLKEIVNM
ncbi:hypothetical protein CK203_029776 [Vitis vinifera]|uniref:Ubiquitin-like protease family profile domain-containing protein n=1 Tax=Vitis vinifera TaxID=29760 RepID=A0A438II57_VITVI|nr:hypothetical protein CK203_029776 [Vitis vinifera]